jgi:acetyl-CoA synthetase
VTASGRAEVSTPVLRSEVARAIGPIAKPKHIVVVPDLPKTRSGKIMRRLLAQLWEAEQDRRAGRASAQLGDTTSLQNPWAVDDIAAVLETAELRT